MHGYFNVYTCTHPFHVFRAQIDFDIKSRGNIVCLYMTKNMTIEIFLLQFNLVFPILILEPEYDCFNLTQISEYMTLSVSVNPE